MAVLPPMGRPRTAIDHAKADPPGPPRPLNGGAMPLRQPSIRRLHRTRPGRTRRMHAQRATRRRLQGASLPWQLPPLASRTRTCRRSSTRSLPVTRMPRLRTTHRSAPPSRSLNLGRSLKNRRPRATLLRCRAGSRSRCASRHNQARESLAPTARRLSRRRWQARSVRVLNLRRLS